MDDSGKIEGVGQGFFNETGKLKSNEQLDAENQKTKERQKPTEIVDASSSSVTNALGGVRARFSEDTNKVASALNVNESNTKEAQEVVKEQLRVARDLRDALKSADKKEIAARKEELVKLEETRAQISERIKGDNGKQVEVLHKNISFGNSQKGIVEVRPVEFEQNKTSAVEVKNTKDVNRYIDDLKEDQDSLRAQRQEQRDTRSQVRSIVEDVDRDVSRIEGESIRSFEEASRTSQRLANEIRNNSQNVFQNVSVSAVQKLLSA